jgi:colicin import membrane protein
MSALQSYALPLIGAVLLHSLVAVFVMRGFDNQDDIAEVITPKVVNAKLLVMEPPKQVSPAPSKQPAVKRAEPSAPKSQPAPKEIKPEPVESTDAAAKAAQAERQRKELDAQRRRERLAALGELADDSLQRSLKAEAEQMLDAQNEQLVRTFQAGIYDLVRKNWSRPPSARNGMQARFVVELIPTGELLSVALVDSSGNAAFDRSAELAIRRAKRFRVPVDNAIFEANFRRFYFLFRPEDLLR